MCVVNWQFTYKTRVIILFYTILKKLYNINAIKKIINYICLVSIINTFSIQFFLKNIILSKIKLQKILWLDLKKILYNP